MFKRALAGGSRADDGARDEPPERHARRAGAAEPGRPRRVPPRHRSAGLEGKLGALLAQFPPSFKDTPASRDYLASLLRAFVRLSSRRRTAALAAGATHRRDAGAAQRLRRRVGADRRAEVPVLDPPELPAERRRLLLHAAARPERDEVVAAREVGGSLRLPVLGRRAEGVLRDRRRARSGW